MSLTLSDGTPAKRYKVELQRTTTESATVEVVAQDRDAAKREAVNHEYAEWEWAREDIDVTDIEEIE